MLTLIITLIFCSFKFKENKIFLESDEIFPDEIELTIVRDHALDTKLNMIMCLYENFFIV